MKVRISAGHTPYGKGAHGAVGYLNESVEDRLITDAAEKYLKAEGHSVVDCTDNQKHTKSENLAAIVNKHNKAKCDIHTSIHLNALSGKVKADGKNKGVEVLITGNFKDAKEKATQICKNIAKLGFTNRGAKIRKDLYFLRKTEGAALLVECCFVDDEDDYKLYKKVGSEAIGKAIAYGLMEKAVPTVEKLYIVQSGAFTDKKKAEEHAEKLKAAGFEAVIKAE